MLHMYTSSKILYKYICIWTEYIRAPVRVASTAIDGSSPSTCVPMMPGAGCKSLTNEGAVRGGGAETWSELTRWFGCFASTAPRAWDVLVGRVSGRVHGEVSQLLRIGWPWTFLSVPARAVGGVDTWLGWDGTKISGGEPRNPSRAAPRHVLLVPYIEGRERNCFQVSPRSQKQDIVVVAKS